MRIVVLSLFALFALLAVACDDNGDNEIVESDGPCQPPSSSPPPAEGARYTTDSGVQVTIVHPPREQDPAGPGDGVAVHYAGWLEDGTLFDTSLDADCEPLVFGLGVGRVIQGWDDGLDGMSPGEVRRLVIPPELGYGDQGFGDVIPPGATLIFDVELVAFGRADEPAQDPEESGDPVEESVE